MIDEGYSTADERDGVVCIKSVIDPALAEFMLEDSIKVMVRARRQYSADMTFKTRMGDIATVGSGQGRFFSAAYLSDSVPTFRDFAMKSSLTGHATVLMRSKIARIFYDQLFMKGPGTVSLIA